MKKITLFLVLIMVAALHSSAFAQDSPQIKEGGQTLVEAMEYAYAILSADVDFKKLPKEEKVVRFEKALSDYFGSKGIANLSDLQSGEKKYEVPSNLNKYFSKIGRVADTKRGAKNVDKAVAKLERKINKDKSLTEGQRDVLLTITDVTKASSDYWKKNHHKWSALMN